MPRASNWLAGCDASNTPYTKPLVLLAHQLYHLGDGVLQLLHVDGTAVDSLDKYLVVEGRLDFIRMLVLIDLLLQHLPFVVAESNWMYSSEENCSLLTSTPN